MMLPLVLGCEFQIANGAALHERTGRVQNRGGVEAVIIVKLWNAAALSELVDAERRRAMAMHAAKPRQGRGMTVDHSDNAAKRGQIGQQRFDMRLRSLVAA